MHAERPDRIGLAFFLHPRQARPQRLVIDHRLDAVVAVRWQFQVERRFVRPPRRQRFPGGHQHGDLAVAVVPNRTAGSSTGSSVTLSNRTCAGSGVASSPQ